MLLSPYFIFLLPAFVETDACCANTPSQKYKEMGIYLSPSQSSLLPVYIYIIIFSYTLSRASSLTFSMVNNAFSSVFATVLKAFYENQELFEVAA